MTSLQETNKRAKFYLDQSFLIRSSIPDITEEKPVHQQNLIKATTIYIKMTTEKASSSSSKTPRLVQNQTATKYFHSTSKIYQILNRLIFFCIKDTTLSKD